MSNNAADTSLVWLSPVRVPRDGSPVLLLLSSWGVYSARWNNGRWMGMDTENAPDSVIFHEGGEDESRIIGWLPFPLISDPFPPQPKPKKVKT